MVSFSAWLLELGDVSIMRLDSTLCFGHHFVLLDAECAGLQQLMNSCSWAPLSTLVLFMVVLELASDFCFNSRRNGGWCHGVLAPITCFSQYLPSLVSRLDLWSSSNSTISLPEGQLAKPTGKVESCVPALSPDHHRSWSVYMSWFSENMFSLHRTSLGLMSLTSSKRREPGNIVVHSLPFHPLLH